MSGISRWRSSTFSAIGFASSHILSRGTRGKEHEGEHIGCGFYCQRRSTRAATVRERRKSDTRAFTLLGPSVLTAADERPLHVVAASAGAGGLLRQWRDPGRGAVADGCADPRITGKTALSRPGAQALQPAQHRCPGSGVDDRRVQPDLVQGAAPATVFFPPRRCAGTEAVAGVRAD